MINHTASRRLLESIKCCVFSKNIWNFELVKQGDIEEFNNGKITVLSPDYNGLEKLKGFTEKIRDLDVAGKKFDFSTNINDFDLTNFKDDEDDSTENETSISFMFEYNKKRLYSCIKVVHL